MLYTHAVTELVQLKLFHHRLSRTGLVGLEGGTSKPARVRGGEGEWARSSSSELALGRIAEGAMEGLGDVSMCTGLPFLGSKGL